MKELIHTNVEEMKQGFVHDGARDVYTCSLCGKEFAQGEIYPMGECLFDARRAAAEHVRRAHGQPFEILLNLNKRFTGLTPNQRELLRLFRGGLTDAQIAAKMGVTPSTVRHQRFTLRERAKQARAYLAVYELALDGSENPPLMEIPSGATVLDERYSVTMDEEEKILSVFFYSLSPLKLKSFSSKDKKKIVILKRIAQEFQRGRTYTEEEVNDTLRSVFGDYVTLRRYLIEYGFLGRERDGSAYWVKNECQALPENGERGIMEETVDE